MPALLLCLELWVVAIECQAHQQRPIKRPIWGIEIKHLDTSSQPLAANHPTHFDGQNNPSTKPIHGTNHSDKPAGVSLALRCPSGLNANQSIEDTLKFKIAK